MSNCLPRLSGLLLTALLCAAVLAGQPALAQDQAEATGPSTRVLMDAQVAEYRDRMGLSDYQWAQVEMIMKSAAREWLALAQQYGLNPGEEVLGSLAPKAKRQLADDLKEQGKLTAERLERYLDKPQRKEFKAIQEEIRTGLLARIEEVDD